jgi:hypothetical protein
MYSTLKKDGDIIFASFADDSVCENKVYGFY